jgi:hypothetical protein
MRATSFLGCKSRGGSRSHFAVTLITGSPSALEPINHPLEPLVLPLRHRDCIRNSCASIETCVLFRARVNYEPHRGTESASELHRPSDCHLSAKLMPTFEDRGVSRSQRNGSLYQYSRYSRSEPLLFLRSSSSVVLTRLSGPRSRPTASQKIW